MLRAMFNTYGNELRTAAQMIGDAKAGSITPPGKGLLDAKGSAADLKAAITQYTSDRLDAKYLGTKLTNDRGRITDGLVLDGDYDSHSKVNLWFVKRANFSPEAPCG